MGEILAERAPAKINLTLHITGRRADGWHTLESLVAFSKSGDLLTLDPGQSVSLAVEGRSAAATGPLENNLVLAASRQFAKRFSGASLGAFRLHKRLPVAAGLGGGSSDAAAALRLLARANAIALDDPLLQDAARATGADVPVCLRGRARMMRGVGDELGPILELPPAVALLVNPGMPVATKEVFAAMGIEAATETGFGDHPEILPDMPFDALMAGLRKGRNDMEAAACRLAPIVGDVLAVLSAAPGCRLARMSGSGATCFALFQNCRAAGRVKKAILRAHPNWWVKASMLR
ncbi:MAG TPA: 4-(cytidine 5'-diphospho)-2-C-methyl-D-erythritol kinase [Methylocella sp.]|nr:4-(cytidine 5'-diphospho)-2-C-methyl-D-erythritol kinase [Methylocella sp.]